MIGRSLRRVYHQWQLWFALAIAVLGPGLTREGGCYYAIGLQILRQIFERPGGVPLLALLLSIHFLVLFIVLFAATAISLLLAAAFRMLAGQPSDDGGA